MIEIKTLKELYNENIITIDYLRKLLDEMIIDMDDYLYIINKSDE